MHPERFDGVKAGIPVSVVKITIVGEMKAYHLFDAMFE